MGGVYSLISSEFLFYGFCTDTGHLKANENIKASFLEFLFLFIYFFLRKKKTFLVENFLLHKPGKNIQQIIA